MEKPEIKTNFENGEKIEITEFADLTIPHTKELQDKISQSEDISYLSKEVLESASFDSNFRWPKKLPDGFEPQMLLEECKNPGLGIRELHKEGITGKGMIVGIIDQNVSPTHTEIKDNLISNKRYHKSKIEEGHISMHGPAVASLLVGKNCGVAPDAKLFYADKGEGGERFGEQTKALEDMIEYNKTHNPKIRIVSISKGYSDNELENPEVKKWIEIRKKAQEQGIIVIDSNYFGDNLITGGGSKTNKDKFDDYELPLFYDNSFSELNLDDIKKKVSLLDDKTQKKFFDKYKTYQNYLDLMKAKISNEIIVPSDYRSMASSQGNNEYRYDAKGGWSWAIPYFAGVFTLALQINPDLTDDKFLEIVRKTAGRNKKGIRVINPLGIIEEVKKMIMIQ